MIINKTVYPVPRNIATITKMQNQMDNLLQQIATGRRYNTLAEIGPDRVHDLNLRARMGRIEGYKANIQTVENKLSFQNNVLERLAEIKSDTKAIATPNAYGTDGLNLATAQQQSENMLKEVIDLLNTDVVGQYIFGGNASDTKPATAYEMIMHGDNGKDGFVHVRDERHAADGVGQTGRLATEIDPDNPAAVILAEDGDHPFGFKLSTVSGGAGYATITGITAPHDPEDAQANQIAVEFTDISALSEGDEITIGVSYPDDRTRTEYITLKATTADPAPAGSYLIGSDEENTAKNFQEALDHSIGTLAETKLNPASTYAAADNFFNASGEPVMRAVGGPPADELVADANHDSTVRWYNGQDVGKDGNPRQTVSANIDESTKVHFGVQANEYGINELVKSLAVFASSSFSDYQADPDLTPEENAEAKQAHKDRTGALYDSTSSLQRERLSSDNNSRPGSIEVITMELALANVTMDKVKSRHTQYEAQLGIMLADIEEAPPEEVAMQVMALQTRLNASYQVTSMVSQLTLVNYLR